MSILDDDALGLILSLIHDKSDRRSFSQVCKQWLRVEGLTRSSITVLDPGILRHFLPRFPYLILFESSKLLSDSDLQFIAQSCPSLEILNLNYKPPRHEFDGESSEFDDFGDLGLSAIASGCRKLIKVVLRRRGNIGNLGVISLVKLATNLTSLDLRHSLITDETLETIGAAAKSITVLNLQGCSSITDGGLISLAEGSAAMTLRKLILEDCDQISDIGVISLMEMSCLEELSLSDCGPKVTDLGGMAISGIPSLKFLNLSWLVNISDFAIAVIAEYCLNLVELNLTGCEFISGNGIRSFKNHQSLESLILVSCHNFGGQDVVQLVEKCRSMRYILLDRGMKSFISRSVQDYISSFCQLQWRFIQPRCCNRVDV